MQSKSNNYNFKQAQEKVLNMGDQHQIQTSQHPPALPTYILRGHTAQIHSVHFLRSNTRILTGDADGWVVLWDIATKRAVGVWKAHKTTILGLGSSEDGIIITYVAFSVSRMFTNGPSRHGRDNKLYVWRLGFEDEKVLSTKLPIEDVDSDTSTRPKLLHDLDVNTLNFCSFAMCHAEEGEILIAVPGVQDGHINIMSLPTKNRIATLASPNSINTGMVMALGLVYQSDRLLLLAGYESGHACIWAQQKSHHFKVMYLEKSHAQPILSIGIAHSQETWFTSAADAIIARHSWNPSLETKVMQTKHAGQQGLAVRNDEKIFATAGWDGRMRVYSVKSMKELAVLKWHGEGCYAVAFADVLDEGDMIVTSATRHRSVTDEGDMIDTSAAQHRSLTVAELRREKAKRTHWLAAGSKDGKVSLWEIY